MMHKDHPDVYHFFIEGVEQELLNGEVLNGYIQVDIKLLNYCNIKWIIQLFLLHW